VSYYASTRELEEELVATLERFLASSEYKTLSQAAAEQGADAPTLLARTADPEASFTVDLRSATVVPGETETADVVLELDADALHDILLDRLDPVQISRLYETDRVTFRGSAEHLCALILLAGRLQPHYEASLRERGRTDLLETPAPPTRVTWGDPSEPPRPLLHDRRPWQRPKRAAARAG
jgi:hypothetical protein